MCLKEQLLAPLPGLGLIICSCDDTAVVRGGGDGDGPWHVLAY